MTRPKAVSVDTGELELAFEFVSSGRQYENNAYVSIETGRIYWSSAMLDMEEEDLPDDLGAPDLYIAVPHKNELGLGRALVFDFINRHLPEADDIVAGFFRRRGAYGPFKQYLDRRKMLDRWFAFENEATGKALRDWCEEAGIHLSRKER